MPGTPPHRLLAVLALIALSGPAQAPAAADPGVFLISREGPRFALERVEVPDGETRVIPAGPATGVVGVVFPPGPGVSGSIEQPRPGRMIVLRRSGSLLHCEVRAGDRSSGLPDRDIAQLAAHDTRVSVIAADGARATFFISGYDSAEADSGPLQNLFAGAPIPLGGLDCIVTTDTYPRDAGPAVRGETALEFRGHAYARVRGPGGHEGWFIVDTGAAETVVARDFLPDTARIAEAGMIEYSAAGRRVLDYAPSGAGGPVRGVLGHAKLSELATGSLVFGDVEAAVLPSMPDFFDRPVAGIIGIDLLRRSGVVSISVPAGAEGEGMLRLGDAPAPRDGDHAVPFSRVSSHLVLPVEVNGVKTHMLFDTGAPRTLVDSTSAVAAGIPFAPSRTARGLDGAGVAASSGVISALGLGGHALADVPCDVSALSVFRTLRAPGQFVGLIGNALLARFDRVDIDFAHRCVVFPGARGEP